jgi:hypothetical protein
MPYINCEVCGLPKIHTWNDDLTAYRGKTVCEVCEIRAKASRKRSSKVFTSDEIPHLFVHQIQSEAWTSSHNLSFSGPNYKSYATIVASRVVNRKGELAFLIDTCRHSMTTGRQLDALDRAIPSGTKIMYVDRPQVDNGREYVKTNEVDAYGDARYEYRDKKNGPTSDHTKNLDYWTRQVERKLRESATSREPKKSRLMGEAASEVDKMREYVAFFDIKKVKYPKLPGSVAELAVMQAANVKRDAAEKKRKEAARKAEDERLRIQYADDRERWLSGLTSRNGTYWNRYFPCELRIVGDEVETSQGATFPLHHAKRGLALVESVVSRGEEWRRNGHTCHLGHYQIDHIEANGTVHAGCHVVPFDAIQRIREAVMSSIAVTSDAEVA